MDRHGDEWVLDSLRGDKAAATAAAAAAMAAGPCPCPLICDVAHAWGRLGFTGLLAGAELAPACDSPGVLDCGRKIPGGSAEGV